MAPIISYEDYKTLLENHPQMNILTPYKEDIWDAISFIESEQEQVKHILENQEVIVAVTESLLIFTKTIISYHNKALKPVMKAAEKVCQFEIIRGLDQILITNIDELRRFVVPDDPMSQYMAYVARPLDKLPSPEMIPIDEATGIIPTRELQRLHRSIKSVQTAVRHILPEECTLTLLIWEIYKSPIPSSAEYYRAIYELLAAIGFIPQEIVLQHNEQMEDKDKQYGAYCREKYINRIVKRSPGA